MSLSCISEVARQTNLDQLMDKLVLPRFTARELTFIGEYCKVLEPIANALNILQGEEKSFAGIFN